MNCFHYTPGHLSLSRTNLSWQKNNSWPSPHISLLSTLSLLKNWGWCFLRLLLVQHFHQTIHRSPRAEYLPPCESVRFASVRSSVRSRLGPPFIENAAVKTAAFSRLTTEIPQTDFCFNYLTGTPFQECPSFLFVPIQFSASQLISLEVAAISQTVAFSA